VIDVTEAVKAPTGDQWGKRLERKYARTWHEPTWHPKIPVPWVNFQQQGQAASLLGLMKLTQKLGNEYQRHLFFAFDIVVIGRAVFPQGDHTQPWVKFQHR
jgi:hypothetical protein